MVFGQVYRPTSKSPAPPPPPPLAAPPPPPKAPSPKAPAASTLKKPSLAKLGGQATDADRGELLKALNSGDAARARLRPTQTRDKSAPAVTAEIEEEKPAVPPPRVVTTPAPPPPPPPAGIAPPPPPPAVRKPSPGPPKNSALAKLGGQATDADRGALLKALNGPVRLRPTQTVDKSAPVVTAEIEEKEGGVRLRVDEAVRSGAATPNSMDGSLAGSRNSLDSQGFSIRYTEDSSSDRFNSSSSEPESDFYRSRQSTGSVSSYASAPVLAPAQPPPPVPITSPPTPPPPKEFQWAKADGQWTKEPINNAENSEPKVGDVRFEERNLYVTKEDLEAEIPSGAALARIAAFKQLEQAAAQSGASGTLPRSRAVTPTRKVLDSFQNGAEAQQKPMNAVQQRQSMPSQSGNSWPRNATPANGGDARRQSTPPKTNGYMPAKPVNGTVSNGTIQKTPENRPKAPTVPRWGQASPQPAAIQISPPASKSFAQPVKPTQPISVQVESNATMGRPAKPAQSPAKPAASPCATNGWVKPAHNVVAPQNSRVCPQPMKNTEPISVQVNNSPQSQRFPAFTPSPSKPSASPSNIRNADIKPISVQVSSPSQSMRPPSSTPSPSIPAASPGNGQKADVKPAQNSSSGPYRFQKHNSPGLSPQLGSPQQATNNVPRPYQTSLSPVSPKQTGPVSPASSTSSLRSSGSTPSTASSSLSMPTADDRRGRGQSSQPRAGSSSGIGTASSSAASSLSPPLRSTSSSPMAKPTVIQAPSTSTSGPPPTPVEGPCPPAGAFRRMFHLRSGTAGTENNANFERLRQSFSKNGDSSTASPTPASPGPLRKSASCVDAMRSGAAADSSTLPKSGEAVWKTAATAKKMQQQSAAKDTNGTATQPARPASVTPVPIKAPWYRKENYEDAEAAKNGTSAAKQTPIAIKLNRAGTSGGSSQASQPSVSQQQLGKLEKMDPSSLRSNYKFAINLNSDDPINIVRR